MHIVHVITRLIVGGAQENTLATVLGLRAQPGVTVRLISGPTVGPEGSLEGRAAGVLELLRLVPNLVRPIHPWKDVLAWRCLVSLLREERPDLVHTHSGKAGFLGRLAARRVRARRVVHTIHGPSFGSFQGAGPNGVFRAAERLAARYTHHFISVSDAMTRQYLASGIGRPDQYTTIYSGFQLEPFLSLDHAREIRASLGIGPDDFVVGKVARLCALKGHEHLLAAAPELVRHGRSVKFLLVGDGHWRERYEAGVRRLGLQDHFIFTGLVPPERIPDLLGAMDVLVHLSRREGLPRALPQAMAAVKPVLAYDCDGAREVCRDGETGFLLPYASSIVPPLIQLLRSPELRSRLGSAGRRLVRDKFSESKMVDDILSLYRRLLA